MVFKEKRPIYLQIADHICDEILSEKYKESERIPSVREYAAIYEVNPNTMVRTFDYMQNNDIVFNKRGMGYFVAEGANDTIRRIRKQSFIDEAVPEFFKEMDILDISVDEIIKMYNDRSR